MTKRRLAPPSCEKPDRDNPKLICGYPIPCPHHTVTVISGKVKAPKGTSALTKQRIRQIRNALK